MADMGAPKSMDQRDFLVIEGKDLHRPMLTEFLRSQELKLDLLEVAREIERQWGTKVSHDTGNLRSTGRVRAIKYPGHRTPGWHWEGVFQAGGAQAPYAPEVEAEEHALADVLTEMGFTKYDRLFI